jgi:ADP-ribose pyrophosphatase
VIEIPAGLAGDVKGSEDEALAKAARRRAAGRNGYTARGNKAGRGRRAVGGHLRRGHHVCFSRRDLKKTADAHGDGSEQITTHLVPVDKVESWIKRQLKAGKQVDLKVYSALTGRRASCTGDACVARTRATQPFNATRGQLEATGRARHGRRSVRS